MFWSGWDSRCFCLFTDLPPLTHLPCASRLLSGSQFIYYNQKGDNSLHSNRAETEVALVQLNLAFCLIADFIIMLVINKSYHPIKNLAPNTKENCYIQTMGECLGRSQNKRAIKPHQDMEETSTHVTKWRKPILKGRTLCDFNYMTFWKRQNNSGSKRDGGRPEVRGIYKMVNREAWVYLFLE